MRLAAGFVVALAFAGIGIGGLAPVAPAQADVQVDNDHDGIDDNFEQKLAERFAPVLFIEHDESNYPVNVEWFLARAHLHYHEDCTGDVEHEGFGPNPIGTQENLLGPPWSDGPYCGQDDEGYEHPPHRLLTTTAADPDGQVSAGAATTGYSDQQTFLLPDLQGSDRVGSTNPADWRTYTHVYPTKDGGVMIQYWHVFSYNELSVAGFGNHGGDWDASIQVQLDSSLALEGIWFSRHGDDHPGDFFTHDSTFLHFYGTHPLMTIDGGGHAAFANPLDFCDKHSIAGGTIAWPTDLTDPTNPAKLGATNALFSCVGELALTGGIVWETWTGGKVRAAGELTHPIPELSDHGGLVNLGEYNPCTPTTCNGDDQASKLLAGRFYPLNGQIFIQYSGRWGDLGTMNPPRGPVFQGWHDNGEGNISYYYSWYNQGADGPPIADAGHPWLVPPSTTATLSGPTYADGGVTFVSGATTVSLSATQNSIADHFGQLTTYYRVYAAGAVPGSFSQYAGPFALSAPDGPQIVEYRSVDALGNVEGTRTLALTLDTTAPSVTITQPVATTYPHSGTITLVYGATDVGSGLASTVATLDGQTTLAGHGLDSGQVINLLTELAVGDHVFQVTALDHLGNGSAPSVTFSIVVTAESIKDDVRYFLSVGAVTQDEGTSLLKKLAAAAKYRAVGDCVDANATYRAFINELTAQSGKKVAATAAAIMIADAQYLISHCP
jgi:hypothetical protein